MNENHKRILKLVITLLFVILFIACILCFYLFVGNKVNFLNFLRLDPAMALSDIERILGKGKRIQNGKFNSPYLAQDFVGETVLVPIESGVASVYLPTKYNDWTSNQIQKTIGLSIREWEYNNRAKFYEWTNGSKRIVGGFIADGSICVGIQWQRKHKPFDPFAPQ